MLGLPESYDGKEREGRVLARSYIGVDVRRAMFVGGRKTFVNLIGLGTKKKPIWFIDKTEEIVEGLKTVGACFISHAHCDFVQISPKVKQCKYCKRKLYKQIITRKDTYWLPKESYANSNKR